MSFAFSVCQGVSNKRGDSRYVETRWRSRGRLFANARTQACSGLPPASVTSNAMPQSKRTLTAVSGQWPARNYTHSAAGNSVARQEQCPSTACEDIRVDENMQGNNQCPKPLFGHAPTTDQTICFLNTYQKQTEILNGKRIKTLFPKFPREQTRLNKN